MRHILPVLLFFIPVLLAAQTVIENDGDRDMINPFDTLRYDRVIAYTLNTEPYSQYAPEYQDTRPENERLHARKELTKEEIGIFTAIVSDTLTYGMQYADCFYPRLGLAFERNGERAMTIEICLECGHLQSTIPLPAAQKYYYEIETFESDATGVVDASRPTAFGRYMKGFSRKGYEQLAAFCENLKMDYCLSPETAAGYDEHLDAQE